MRISTHMAQFMSLPYRILKPRKVLMESLAMLIFLLLMMFLFPRLTLGVVLGILFSLD